MAHVFEIAPTGRARCRGCNTAIAKGDVRFGERMPNAFGEGEMTLWFHPLCASFKRPEPFLEALAAYDEAGAAGSAGEAPPLEGRAALETAARFGLAHRRLPRLDGAGRAPSGRARCRSCREPIAKDAWRFALVYYQEGRFEPSGFIHVGCSQDYFETTDVLDRVRHFSDLGADEMAEIARDMGRPGS